MKLSACGGGGVGAGSNLSRLRRCGRNALFENLCLATHRPPPTSTSTGERNFSKEKGESEVSEDEDG